MSHIMSKPTKWHVLLAKTQISLGIRPVWSESSRCAQWVVKDPTFFHVDSKDSDQTGRMPRLIWIFAGCTCHFVGFDMRRLISKSFFGITILKVRCSGPKHCSSISMWCFLIVTGAATWQNQQSDCAPSEDSDQPGHPPSLIRVFAVRMKKPWVLSYPFSAQGRLGSDWADAQADLSLRWAHSHFVGFVTGWLIYCWLLFILSQQLTHHTILVWTQLSVPLPIRVSSWVVSLYSRRQLIWPSSWPLIWEQRL